MKSQSIEEVYDLIGIGLGPSNLAVAVAAEETAPFLHRIFLEQNTHIDWHPGLLFKNARMQVAFLKDLVTISNPRSKFTFLSYLKDMGRLEMFVNMRETSITRLEYRDYLRWTAEQLRQSLHFSERVTRVTPYQSASSQINDLYKIETELMTSGVSYTYLTRTLVVATGERVESHWPFRTSQRLIHSSEFLLRFPTIMEGLREDARIAIVGGGQSAAEIAIDILEKYADARVSLYIPGIALRGVDDTPFVNEGSVSVGATGRFWRKRRAGITSRAMK